MVTLSVATQLPSQHCCGEGAVEEEVACFESDEALLILIFAVALLKVE